MPNWLSDPPRSLYIILLLAGVLPLLAAFFLVGRRPPPRRPDPKRKPSSPRRPLIIAGVIGLLALAGLYVCDRVHESDREQIVRKLQEMSAGVRERNLGRVFQHVSDTFQFGSATKEQLRAAGQRALDNGLVRDIPIWDIKIDPVAKGDTKALARFRFKVVGDSMRPENQFYCHAHFVREGAEWRLQSFKVFSPLNERDEMPVPGL